MVEHYAISTQEATMNIRLVSMYISNVDKDYSNPFTSYTKPLTQFNSFVGFVLTLSGEGLISTRDEGDLVVYAGDLVFLRHHDCRGFFAHGNNNWRFYCVWFYGKNIPITFYKPFQITPPENHEERMKEIIFNAKKTDYLESSKANGLALNFVCDLIQLANSTALPNTHPQFITDVEEYINNNLFENLRVSDLAKQFGFCENHFCNVFKKHFKTTPKQYILEKKIQQAAYMLSYSDAPINSVAIDLGFYSSTHFIRYFKSIYRQTPSEYRLSHNFFNFKT